MNTQRDELMLDSMGPSVNGGIEIKTHAGGPKTSAALLLMADAMKDALNEHNAENYLEMDLRASDKKQYVMTLQRRGKLTPHQARLNAEAEVAALKAAQPRVIETTEELDTLPGATVVRSAAGVVYVKDYEIDDPYTGWWMTAGAVSEFQSNRISLPATVLHEAKS